MKQAPLQDATLEALAAHVFAEIRALSPDSAGVSRPAFSGIETKVLDWLAEFARAQGLPEGRIMKVHVMKNIMIPIVTITGIEFGSLIAFSVVTESIFAWPGMGKLIIDSINMLDRPVIVAYLLIMVLLFVTLNLVVDILYTMLDPRVRMSAQG